MATLLRQCAGTISRNRVKISIEEPGVARCRQVGINSMASVSQLNPYHCDQCGAANVVAAPVLYQHGTHSYSTRFSSGTTQSFSAKAAAPPDSRGYGRPLLLWGIPICFTFFWGFAGLGRILAHPTSLATLSETVAIFLILGFIFLGGMLLNFRRIARYNRETYPHIHRTCEHTYVCRRCGRFRLISP